MDKFAAYKEAYKQIIIEELVKEAKYEKAVDPAKKLWKELYGQQRQLVNVGKDKNPMLYTAAQLLMAPFTGGLAELGAKGLSRTAGITDNKKTLDMLRKALMGNNVNPIPNTFADKSKSMFNQLIDKGVFKDGNLSKADKILSLANNRTKDLKNQLTESVRHGEAMETLAKILGGTTALGAVGTGYGLVTD